VRILTDQLDLSFSCFLHFVHVIFGFFTLVFKSDTTVDRDEFGKYIDDPMNVRWAR
jgi:hypothetical protein